MKSFLPEITQDPCIFSNIDAEYEKFVDDYFEGVAELCGGNRSCFSIPDISGPLMSPKAVMSKEEWLEREIKTAANIEDYTRCIRLRDYSIKLKIFKYLKSNICTN